MCLVVWELIQTKQRELSLSKTTDVFMFSLITEIEDYFPSMVFLLIFLEILDVSGVVCLYKKTIEECVMYFSETYMAALLAP